MARKKNENIEYMENTQDNTETVTNKKYKTEKCRILSYNKATKELDIDFHGYGIRIKNADKKIYDIFNSLVGVDLYEC